MTYDFEGLHLLGFKSFVEPTEVPIEPGLTGIIGPNGCGKSNLVEALRWVMGESSAKRMRGAEMDDVIFSGSGDRPSRNMAEVRISLGNSARQAPAAFNDEDEIEISRRIERGQGSVYRINGRDVRAQDVRLLFADAATGARSTAIVSQGQIGAFIQAKPEQRRLILEEAAGITGLHSRRHEAELRLAATDRNLEKANDALAMLEEQIRGLKRQATRANRYRRLSDYIRGAEAALFRARWAMAENLHRSAVEALGLASEAVARATTEATSARNAHLKLNETLPSLREAEAEAGAGLSRLRAARETLENEARRIDGDIESTRARLADIETDRARAEAGAREAGEDVERLTRVRDELVETGKNGAWRMTEAAERARNAQADLAAAEAAWTGSDRALGSFRTERLNLDTRLAEANARHERIAGKAGEIGDERARLEAEAAPEGELAAAADRTREAGEALRLAEEEIETLREREREAETAAAAARTAAGEARDEWSRLDAEARALAGVAERDGEWPAIIENLQVEPGFEAALGAALGEDLYAAEDDQAPMFWSPLELVQDPPALPRETEPLGAHVRAPAALTARLAQIGIAPDAGTAAHLQPRLSCGQRLVTRDGGLWRWDGYTLAPGAPTAAARRLEQRNRLDELEGKLEEAKTALHGAEEGRREAERRLEAVRGALEAARETVAAARETESREREAGARLSRDAEVRALQLDAARERERQYAGELEEAARHVREIEAGLAGLDDPDRLQAEADRARAARDACKERADDANRESIRLEEEVRGREIRLRGLAEDIEQAGARARNAAEQIERLDARRESEERALEEFLRRPAEIEGQRAALLDELEKLDARRREAGDRLSEAETATAEADRHVRAKEAALSGAREERIRIEGEQKNAERALSDLSERIRERLQIGPEGLDEIADSTDGDIEALERRVERLIRERETMGEVNLRAEQEVREIGERIEELAGERDDLMEATAKLRRGIGELNREARTRLRTAFEEVNGHFTALFKRLFDGGDARLSLIGSEDPLEAGLEIMASPPGKKMQVLSLLSGGERALTALSLLFSVFLTNPAPVCVLDEVDAPLDDANVDRFCGLLEDIAEQSNTRFLVVTHHRLTQARMNRLFGVTMSEAGVSQLVSVDLRNVDNLRATA